MPLRLTRAARAKHERGLPIALVRGNMLDGSPTLFSQKLFRTLAPGVAPLSVAVECRASAVALLDGVHDGWGAREIAKWVEGPYRHVAGVADERHGVSPMAIALDASERLADWPRAVAAELEPAVVGRARVPFVDRALAFGLVVPCVTAGGDAGWAPADIVHASFVERVLSLFAVDCLVRPGDYARELVVCPRCDRVVFDAGARERGACAAHAAYAAPSGIIEAAEPKRAATPRRLHQTLVGMG